MSRIRICIHLFEKDSYIGRQTAFKIISQYSKIYPKIVYKDDLSGLFKKLNLYIPLKKQDESTQCIIFNNKLKNPGKTLVIGAGIIEYDWKRWNIYDPNYIGISHMDPCWLELGIDINWNNIYQTGKPLIESINLYIQSIKGIFPCDHKFEEIIFDRGTIFLKENMKIKNIKHILYHN